MSRLQQSALPGQRLWTQRSFWYRTRGNESREKRIANSPIVQWMTERMAPSLYPPPSLFELQKTLYYDIFILVDKSNVTISEFGVFFILKRKDRWTDWHHKAHLASRLQPPIFAMEKVVQILDSKAAFVKGNVSKGQAPSPAQLSSFLSALRNEVPHEPKKWPLEKIRGWHSVFKKIHVQKANWS